MTFLPLTRRPGGLQVYQAGSATAPQRAADQRTHQGYEWLNVLSGRLRLVLGGRDLVLSSGEVMREPRTSLAPRHRADKRKGVSPQCLGVLPDEAANRRCRVGEHFHHRGYRWR